MKTVILHETTYNYILKSIREKAENPVKIFDAYNGRDFYFPGHRIILSELCEPTIDEPFWVFPEDKFVKYDSRDIEWCRFFGVGRPGIFKMGDIFIRDEDVSRFN